MAHDPLKEFISKQVTRVINENLVDYVHDNEINRPGTMGIGSIEVNDIAPSENMIRITSSKRDGGAPRYFRVKVSEVL